VIGLRSDGTALLKVYTVCQCSASFGKSCQYAVAEYCVVVKYQSFYSFEPIQLQCKVRSWRAEDIDVNHGILAEFRMIWKRKLNVWRTSI
jgi:hypothetical protein